MVLTPTVISPHNYKPPQLQAPMVIKGFSPKRRSVAQRPTILSECSAEKIIKVIKIIYIFSEKRLTKHVKKFVSSSSIVRLLLPRHFASPRTSIPQSGMVAKKQTKRPNKMRANLRKGKLLRITNFHVIMAAKVSIIDPPVSHQDCKNK